MHLIPQSRNLLATAAASMSNQIASTAVRLVSASRTGLGTVDLTGSFTGLVDSTIDIEITGDTVTGDPTVSTPVFSGVGNGALSALTVDPGTAAQTVTVTLTDLGIPTRQAFAPFQSVILRAVAAGVHGSAIDVTIDQSGLTRTLSDYAVTSEIRAGVADYEGEEYRFGAPDIEPEGTVPPTAPRVSFGQDPSVYRHWREFRNNRYTYRLSPAPVRDYPIGTPVYIVTGGRSVTVANGIGTAAAAWVTATVYAAGVGIIPTTPAGLWYECTTGGTSGGTEPTWLTATGATVNDNGVIWTCRGKITTNYPSVATLYDLLSAIEADPTGLVEVEGVVANDRRPGGMACDDLVLFTASYAQEVTGDGTTFVREVTIDLTVASDAPTESVVIRCAANTTTGSEVWDVRGDVSGTLAQAVTGILYADGDYGFTIPERLAPADTPAGRKSVTLEPIPRGPASQIPSACSRQFVLGRDARDNTYTFIWQVRGGAECPCSTLGIIGGPNNDWLGVEPEDTQMGTLAAAIVTPYTTVTDWARDFIVSQVSADDAGGNLPIDSGPNNAGELQVLLEKISSELQIDQVDVQIAKRAAAIWRSAIVDIHAQTDAWDSATNTAFTTEWNAFDTFMDNGFGSLIGADFVARTVQTVLNTNSDTIQNLITEINASATPEQIAWIAQQGERFLTVEIEAIMDRIRAQISNVYVAAGLLVPFDDAARSGTGVWQDHGGTGWFVSQDGLLPLQPGYYYHSSVSQVAEDGSTIYLPTYEFGVGVDIGCPEALLPGDRLIVKIDRVVNPRATYQVGDIITARIVRADPVELGGGQTGDDTLTWRVVASVDGPLDDYALVTTAPAAYSDGGIDFLITPGAIPFELGDAYSFAIEGGQFRWRQDGGTWVESVDIAPTVALADGLSASFAAGAPPSFVVGDAYSFQALATNGIDRLRTPDDRRASWTGSTVIEAVGAAPIDALLLWHDIPSNAAVRLQGSDDGFSTTPFNRLLTWRRGVICALLDAPVTYAEYRITCDTSGSIRWAPLLERLSATHPNGVECAGKLSMVPRLARPGGVRGRDMTMTFDGLANASAEELIAALEHATESHDGVVGIGLVDGEGYVARLEGDPALSDLRNFEPVDAGNRALSLQAQLAAA